MIFTRVGSASCRFGMVSPKRNCSTPARPLADQVAHRDYHAGRRRDRRSDRRSGETSPGRAGLAQARDRIRLATPCPYDRFSNFTAFDLDEWFGDEPARAELMLAGLYTPTRPSYARLSAPTRCRWRQRGGLRFDRATRVRCRFACWFQTAHRGRRLFGRQILSYELADRRSSPTLNPP